LQIFTRNGRKCKQILLFFVFKIWSLSPYRLQIKFSMSLFFYLFTIVINLWHQKFVTADVIAVFVNKQHGIQRRKQNFDKKCVFKEVHSKEVDRRISWKKNWIKHGVNKLLKKLRDTGTVDIATKRNPTTTGSFQSHAHFIKENNYAFECLIF